MPKKPQTSKIIGVTKKNDDLTDRQTLIRLYCKPGDQVVLQPDPASPDDPAAVAVCVREGENLYQIGSLPKRTAQGLDIENNAAFIAVITGGTEEKPALGVTLTIKPVEPPTAKPAPTKLKRTKKQGAAFKLGKMVGNIIKKK